jgi:hypothetical protein
MSKETCERVVVVFLRGDAHRLTALMHDAVFRNVAARTCKRNISHVSDIWVMSLTYASCLLCMSHGSCTWVMSWCGISQCGCQNMYTKYSKKICEIFQKITCNVKYENTYEIWDISYEIWKCICNIKCEILKTHCPNACCSIWPCGGVYVAVYMEYEIY